MVHIQVGIPSSENDLSDVRAALELLQGHTIETPTDQVLADVGIALAVLLRHALGEKAEG